MDLKLLEQTQPWEWPPSAARALKSILRNPSVPPADLMIAAELGGDLVVMDDEMARLLLALVRSADQPDELRAKAAIALGPVLEQADIEGFDDDGLSEPPIGQETFEEIQATLHKVYSAAGNSKLLRRRVLEASVRAPQEWHTDAIRAAYSSRDVEWMLTAVFCMEHVRGFDAQILEQLTSRDSDIRYHAVCAAGNWELHAAWPRIAVLLTSPGTERKLLLAAIEAAPGTGQDEATGILFDLAGSADEETAEAANEALTMAGAFADGDLFDEYDEDEDDEDDDEVEGPRH